MEVLDQERQRITTYLKQRGYYNFTVNNIEYEADTLRRQSSGGPEEMIVKQHLAGYNEQGYPILRNNTVYRIDQIIDVNYDPMAVIAPTTARDSTRSTTGG